MKKLYQQGLSLLELMIALALGLVLVAVAVQMFISSQANLSLQRSLGDLQDNGLFGIDFIAKDLRKINLGASLPVLDSQIAQGGIVLSLRNITGAAVEENASVAVEGLADNEMSGTALLPGSSNFSGQKSDQLTIQYKTVQNVYDDATFLRKINNGLNATEKELVMGYDCEGGKITLEDVANQVYLIQRYWVKPTNQTTTSSNNPNLALYCDAGRYQLGAVEDAYAATAPANRKVTITGLNDNSQMVLRRVDHFRVLLGVATGEYGNSEQFRYMTLSDYQALSGANLPKIRSVKLGLVIRSQDRIPSSSAKKDNNFNILDLASAQLIGGQDNYMRQVLTQTIALRNALGEDLRSEQLQAESVTTATEEQTQ
jgi:type IV pilus assembly protein PilW